MNKVTLSGRLTRDPEIMNCNSKNGETTLAKYTLAVQRSYSRDSEQDADFIRCIAFGKRAEFAEKYLGKGVKIIVCGEIRTGSYEDAEGTRHYTTDVIVSEQEFAESKKQGGTNAGGSGNTNADGFMDIPDGIDDELPFN